MRLNEIYSIMVTESVTCLGSLEEDLVAQREVVGVAHKGSDQAPLYGRRVGTDIYVDSPPELVEAIQNKAKEVIRLYE
jgi:hypothetical protein